MTLSRRHVLRAGAAPDGRVFDVGAQSRGDRVVRNGRLEQSGSRWPYHWIPFPDFCRAVAVMGLTAIDLLEEPGFRGYLAHEFVPTRDPLTSLREAVALCDV
jgi:hydroxypyruvate isomerase